MLCIHWHEELPSTNTEAIRLAKEGAPEGTVVWAERQTAGRGRRGRTWDSPAGNLYMSVIVRPDLPLALAGRISVAVGLRIARLLHNSGIRSKWPNDIYYEGRKAGGILVETRAGPGGRLDWAVVGLGLNVASHPEVEALAQPATHVPDIIRYTDIETMMRFLGKVIVQTSRNASGGFWRVYRTYWLGYDLTNGPIRVVEDDREYDAEGVGIDDDGALLVRVGEEIRRVTAGEVTVRVR
jgi:BirA family biotin operon repressor/biotin-[acetyl-CoA-carboxylase] ligase